LYWIASGTEKLMNVKLKKVWLAAELLGAAGLAKHYKKNTEDWFRIQFATIWLKSVGMARDLMLYQVGVSVCVMMLVVSVIVMEGALIYFIPMSPQARIVAVFVAGGVNFAIAAGLLKFILSSQRWLNKAAQYNSCLEETLKSENTCAGNVK